MFLIIRLYISYILNIIGTFFAIIGAAGVSLGNYRAGFLFYIFADFLLLCLFIGVVRKWWKLDTAAILQVILYAIFFCTAVVGYARVM